MQAIKTNFTRATLSAILALSFGSFTACSNQSPLQSDNSSVLRLAPGELNIVKSLDPPSLNKLFVQEKLITRKDGGQVEVGDKKHGKSRLVFPAGAVSEDLLVRFEWESSGFLEGGATFSPHGAVFLKPVEITLSYKDADLNGINESDLKIWYFNEEVGMWELIGDEVHMDKKYVKGYIEHFSRYAIGAE